MRLLVPPPIQGLVAGGLMWAISTQSSLMPIEFTGRHAIAYGIMAVGIAIEIIAIGQFLRRQTTVNPFAPSQTSVLVVAGLYRFSRNPMYLGLLILLSGWGLFLGEAFNLIVLILFVVIITATQIKPEETVLRDKFGEAYVAYCRRVGRWI